MGCGRSYLSLHAVLSYIEGRGTLIGHGKFFCGDALFVVLLFQVLFEIIGILILILIGIRLRFRLGFDTTKMTTDDHVVFTVFFDFNTS